MAETDGITGTGSGQHSAAAVDEQGAPGRLEVVRRFVNTRDVEDGIEELDTPEATATWLQSQGLPGPDRVSRAQLRRLTALREALRALMLANNSGADDQGALEHLRTEASRAPLQVRFDEGGDSALVPAAKGVDAVVGELLGIVHGAMADGTWPRLKACRSDTCEWAFYDRSRNRSGAWCSMAVCGNREKARSYRHRHGSGKSRT